MLIEIYGIPTWKQFLKVVDWGKQERGGGAPLDYFIAFKRKGIPFFLFKIRLLTEITDKRGKRVFDPMHPT